MNKAFKTVSEMARHITDDKKFHKQLDSEIKKKSIAKVFFALRCQSKITQEEMAKRLGCTQSRISKIEHSSNNKQKVEYLIAYAEVLEMELSIDYRKPMKIVDKVKYHAFEIKKHLDTLAKVAIEKKDNKLHQGSLISLGKPYTTF